jgi:hypothetical protein
MQSCSQSHQDLFALQTAKHKTYIEIGANKPKEISNTYNLEMEGWKGFSLELNRSGKIEKAWKLCVERTNILYWEDALTFNYVDGLLKNNLPLHIGYLSCDIEPPSNTFKALTRVIDQGVSFDCITFEHDNYQNKDGIDYNVLATEYLISKGYKIAVSDIYVANNENQIFETWFVHNTINMNTMTFKDWKKLNNL